MNNKNILFLSSNGIWAGSEVLWASSARQFAIDKYKVRVGVLYDFNVLEDYLHRENYFDLRNRPVKMSILKRVFRKLSFFSLADNNVLDKILAGQKPDLVIISQGNNSDGRRFMKVCVGQSIPYVTLTHLVTEDLWPALNDDIIDDLRKLYKQATRNYFVSGATMSLQEKLLGQSFSNNEVVYNPFRQEQKPALKFPAVKDGLYKIALVGRIEIFHKGYDLLIDVLKQEKWRIRSIQFSLFGKGPHVRILKRLIKVNHILNFTVHDHQEDISMIWAEHHLLLMPSRMEGQALSLIEAMSFGRAAIVTDVGGAAELIEEPFCGFIAPHADKESIDAALERAWNNRDQWEQMGLNASKAIGEKHPPDAVSFFNQKITEILNR